jgi:hypothetical protein
MPMRGSINRLLLPIALLALLVGMASCADGDLDDDDAGDVVMSINTLTATPVTGQRQAGTSGTCSVSAVVCESSLDCAQNEVCLLPQVCFLRVTNWSASIGAQPKNAVAIPPFNDIVMQDVTITYQWVNPGIVTPPFVTGLGNVTIPTGGSNAVTFPPISTDAINNNPAIEGSTANLTLTFRARTVEGAQILQTATRTLIVESCQ